MIKLDLLIIGVPRAMVSAADIERTLERRLKRRLLPERRWRTCDLWVNPYWPVDAFSARLEMDGFCPRLFAGFERLKRSSTAKCCRVTGRNGIVVLEKLEADDAVPEPSGRPKIDEGGLPSGSLLLAS